MLGLTTTSDSFLGPRAAADSAAACMRAWHIIVDGPGASIKLQGFLRDPLWREKCAHARNIMVQGSIQRAHLRGGSAAGLERGLERGRKRALVVVGVIRVDDAVLAQPLYPLPRRLLRILCSSTS